VFIYTQPPIENVNKIMANTSQKGPAQN